MEIKQGDKVIVHYPNGDRIGRIQEVMLDGTYDIDFGGGCTGHNITRLQIEPYTAPEFKIGNWVMISGVFNPQLNGMIGWISRIDKDGNKVSFQDGRFAIVENKYLTLITQPTEQTEAHTDANEKLHEEYMRFMKDCVSCEVYTQSDFLKDYDPSKHEVNSKPRYTPEIMSNTEFWVKYEADLAKEIALKITGKPEDVAEYAVSVAKAVVEGLKKK